MLYSVERRMSRSVETLPLTVRFVFVFWGVEVILGWDGTWCFRGSGRGYFGLGRE